MGDEGVENGFKFKRVRMESSPEKVVEDIAKTIRIILNYMNQYPENSFLLPKSVLPDVLRELRELYIAFKGKEEDDDAGLPI